MKLVIATKNAGKLREVAATLDGCGIELFSLADFPDMPEPDENSPTFIGNALIKSRAVAAHTGLAALADDSGLEVDALDGAPGVRSARFAPDDKSRISRLLELMKDVDDERRTARFVCALALVRPDGFEWTTVGTCEGMITRAPSGANGFGYDPIFRYPPLDATFAEIPGDVKNKVSHRGKAIEAFRQAAATGRLF